MKNLRLSNLLFTADSGCTLDHQIGMEDPACGRNRNCSRVAAAQASDDNSYNFLGIGKSEKKRRDEVLKEVRNKYPAPKSCSEAESVILNIRKDLQDAEAIVSSGQSKNVMPRYVDAYNVVLSEYIAYINGNCLAPSATRSSAAADPGSSAPAGTTATTTQAVNEDPIIKTAVPGNTATPGINPSATATATGSTAAGDNSGANSNAADSTAWYKKVPKWAWWAIGAAALVTTTVVIVKSKT